jgi:hypothetical protein
MRRVHPSILALQSAITLWAEGDPSRVNDILSMAPDELGFVLQLDVDQPPEVLMSTIEKRLRSSEKLADCAFVAALCWLDIIEAVKSSEYEFRRRKVSIVMSRVLYGYMAFFGSESVEYRKVLEAFEAYPGFEYEMLLMGLPVEKFDGEYTSTLMHTFARLGFGEFK